MQLGWSYTRFGPSTVWGMVALRKTCRDLKIRYVSMWCQSLPLSCFFSCTCVHTSWIDTPQQLFFNFPKKTNEHMLGGTMKKSYRRQSKEKNMFFNDSETSKPAANQVSKNDQRHQRLLNRVVLYVSVSGKGNNSQGTNKSQGGNPQRTAFATWIKRGCLWRSKN